MRVPRSSYKPPPHHQPPPPPTTGSGSNSNNTTTTYVSAITGNNNNAIPFSGQLLGNDFGLDLGEIDSGGSACESFTLYKSDFDECGLTEENNDFTIHSDPGPRPQPPQQTNTSSGDPLSAIVGIPKQNTPVSIGSLSTRSPGGADGSSELRREILKNIASGNLKRSSPSPVTGVSPGNANFPTPAPANNKKQCTPKYQFDIGTDFPNRGRPPPTVKKPRGPRAKKENTTSDHTVTNNIQHPIASSDVIGPSASFTISIPSTSKTPATTMYLPFIARRQSLKSHELGANDGNIIRVRESAEENESRRLRVSEALNDRSPIAKDVKYFVDKNIEQYLEKRGYLQPYLRAEKVITKGIFASILSHENAISNCVSFGPQYEAHQIMGEIEKFWEFYLNLKQTHLAMSLELKPILIPMLLYFYLECFVSGLVPVALRLYVEFSKKFLNEDASQESYDILFRIATITSPEAFDDNELLQAFRSQERRFILSLATFERLKKHVLSSQCPLMLHLFSNRFTIQMKDTAGIVEKFVEFPYPDTPQTNKKSTSRAAEVIKRVRENVHADLPALSLYLTSGRPICGAASASGSIIAFGLRDGRGITLEYLKSKHGNDESDSEDLNRSNIKPGASPAPRQLIGHSGGVFDIGFHPLSKRLFSVGQDSTMKVWDLRNGQCKAVYRGHTFPIGALDVAESGILLATGSVDATARIWVPERTNYVRLLAGHYSTVSAIKFHPNEAYIATGSMDTSVRLWSVSDGNMARVFTGFDGKITSLGFHESGKYLLAGGSDPVIRIWDIAQGEVLSELSCPSNCSSIAINQNILCAAFENNQLRFWNLLSILNTSSAPERENENATCSTHQSKKVECSSNSILKLHFTTPRHVIALGEKYGDDKQDSVKKSKKLPRTENFEDAYAEPESPGHFPLTGEGDFLDKVLEDIGAREENDAFSELDHSAFDWPNAEHEEVV